MKRIKGIRFADNKLKLIDQTKLPLELDYIKTDDYERIAIAIEKLEVRGAPAIGIAAAFGTALSFKEKVDNRKEHFVKVFNRLASTRPTAVNLFWALDRMKSIFEQNVDAPNLYDILLKEAQAIYNEDQKMCERIAENGLQIFNKKSNVITHCNTGSLVTAGGGTALNVIAEAHKRDLINHVYADETRPLLQGSRLTAFELDEMNIPFSIITDSTAAFVMKQGKADIVITGADRIAANGDSANKIGTYNLAVLSKHHGIPFYIAAPTSTVDTECKNGNEIRIELRESSEVTRIKNVQLTKKSYPVYTPAFDVTPNELIAGIITEKQIHRPPYNF